MDEQALIALAKQGNLDAFNQLVIHYQDMAYRVAYRIVGDADASADATQDAFLRAYQALGQYRGDSFKGWLLRIVSNCCYDLLRARKRQATTSLEALVAVRPAPDLSLAYRTESPETHAERHDLGQVIQASLGALPPEQRIALVLRDVAGMRYQEIAQVTRASLGTVRSRISRARARLRDLLMAQQEFLPAKYRSETPPGRERALHTTSPGERSAAFQPTGTRRVLKTSIRW